MVSDTTNDYYYAMDTTRSVGKKLKKKNFFINFK